MHGADAPFWAHWLEASALGAWARQSTWGFAAANVLHLLGMAALLGSVLAFDLRVLGLRRALPVAETGRLLLPLARGGFVLAIGSGLVLFSADASHVYVNPAFQVKLLLIGLALLNVVAFHWLAPLAGSAAPGGAAPGIAARVSAGLSLLMWPAVIVCGRMIAYL
ncbi:MAG: hypothetical protein WDN25_26085 [Acetobacteraceae bacterium]